MKCRVGVYAYVCVCVLEACYYAGLYRAFSMHRRGRIVIPPLRLKGLVWG